MMFDAIHEPAQVRAFADNECSEIFARLRRGEYDREEAWGRCQAVNKAADERLLEIAGAATFEQATEGLVAPRVRASKLTDHQLAAAVLRGHLRCMVPRPLRDRLRVAPINAPEPLRLVRAYLVG